MSSLSSGEDTLKTEISHIPPFGVWLLSSSGKELFMPYDSFSPESG